MISEVSKSQTRNYKIKYIFIISFVTIVISSIALSLLYRIIPHKPLPPMDLILLPYPGAISPEPAENFVFLILMVLVPGLLLIIVNKLAKSFLSDTKPAPSSNKYFTIITFAFFFIPLINSKFFKTVFGERSKDGSKAIVYWLIAYILSYIYCNWRISNNHDFASIKKYKIDILIWVAFAIFMSLQLFSWRLAGFSSIINGSPWSIHADVVYYALSQVVAGSTLLVDLPSQYGFFPELLAPLFKVIGFNVLKLSTFFAILQVISLVALYSIFVRFVRSKDVLFLSGITLLLFTYETVVYFDGSYERYYQYWPLRFIWPSLSCFVFHYFLKNYKTNRSIYFSIFSAIGVIWNTETGLVVSTAFGAYLVSKIVQNLDNKLLFRKNLLLLITHILVNLILIGMFLQYLKIKSGQDLNFGWVFEYQHLFYSLGFMMIPLPSPPNPWVAVLAIYLMGLIISLSSFYKNDNSVKKDMLFYLSILGLGLFVYFQGRSHVLNLVSVCWPALTLMAILTSDLLIFLRRGKLIHKNIMLAALGYSIFLFSSFSFLLRLPMMVKDMKRQYSTRGQDENKLFANELEFIKLHSAGKDCLLLTQRQGIYYAETGMRSPHRGPGLVEMLLKSDKNDLVARVMSGQYQCIFLGVGENSSPNLELGEFSKRLTTLATNSEKSIQFVQAKSE